jgi:hypothetical protein
VLHVYSSSSLSDSSIGLGAMIDAVVQFGALAE